MAERDYASQPVADGLGLKSVIDGLAFDLQQLRDGKISPADGLARAALAKQIFNGVRLYLVARNLKAPMSQTPEASPRMVEWKG